MYKIAPAFVFWKNPGRHNLLLRFTDYFKDLSGIVGTEGILCAIFLVEFMVEWSLDGLVKGPNNLKHRLWTHKG